MTEPGNQQPSAGAQPGAPTNSEKLSRWHRLLGWLADASACSPHRPGWAVRPEDRLPPQLPRWELAVLVGADLVLVLSVTFLALACTGLFPWPYLLPAHLGWIYVALAALIAALMVDRTCRYNAKVHDARLDDRAEVEKLISEANCLISQNEHNDKTKCLKELTCKLKELGPMAWIEFEVLPLRQALVEFRPTPDLISQARSSLTSLQDYAEDPLYRYDKELYYDWKLTIEKAVSNVESPHPDADVDSLIKILRAELRTLLEHVADYEANWAAGSAMIRGLFIMGAVAVPVLLAMGMLPILYLGGSVKLEYFNWGFLGIAGALTAGLLTLRKTDVVEVGNTEGSREIWRTVTGATLGFVSGILLHAAVNAELFGNVAPDLSAIDVKNIGLSVLWPVFAGFILDRFYEGAWTPWQGSATS